ncbi:hypothetical protein DL93DRAFT_2108080 [Clavulina sp. PMI_390]|nr:hypothetical protein DL93DRAFT_2108080 [Clavulina sp. PMI_390]
MSNTKNQSVVVGTDEYAPQEPAPPRTSHEPDHFGDSIDERAPLLVPPPPRTIESTNGDDENIGQHLHPGASILNSTRRGDNILGLVAIGSLLAILIFTWVLVLSQPKLTTALKYFAFHPTLQTLAVFLFGIGILLLQPIPSTAPKLKRQGLQLHQIVQLVGLLSIAGGSTLMIVNKIDHGAAHFTTWHGKFGLISIIWILFQVLAGGASVWFGGRLVGGKAKGKALWKYHRISGYLLFTFLLITIHLAGGYSDWVHMVTTKTQRFWIYFVMPIIAFVGLAYRLRVSKLWSGRSR